MSQKSEDSIERFFRKGVVQQDKTFMERDWQSMEAMLDEHAMTAASAKVAKSKIVVRASMMIALISFLFLIGVEKDITESSVQMQAAVGVLGPRIEAKESPAADLHSSDKAERKKVELSPGSSITYKIAKTEKTLRQPAQKQQIKSKILRAKSAIPSSQNRLQLNSDESNLANAPRATLPVSSSAEAPSTITAESKQKESENPGISPLSIASTETTKAEPVIALEKVSVQAESNRSEETEAKGNRSRINVTALISPDFSTTSLSRYSKPSGVFGVLIGYRISKRFTVLAGATKSLKRYEGYGQEYSPPEGYWQSRTNGVIPDEVEGECGVIEVPIMLQVDALQKRTSRVFLSFGVSSYFMRSERYQYTFNEPNPGAANSWSAKEPTDYLFKIGHLSAGYDRLIGRKFTIGVEPFLKVPFEGIGWTNINLYSTGAYFNVRYNIISIQKQ